MNYGDLPVTPEYGVSIACTNEDCEALLERYSASRGDYFMCSKNETVKCLYCEEPMSLIRERTVIEVLP